MTVAQPVAINRALISVSDKTGVVPFALSLHQLGIEILSTGGTHKMLVEAGVPAIEISSYTEFPEMMDGRVKTLHPKVHGGILGRRDQDAETMAAHGISPIDLVVVNLYPFEETVARPDCDLDSAIENIDIGGPTLLRAAAKNHRYVTVVVKPGDYDSILERLRSADGVIDAETRFDLATKAFEHTASYDGAIANYLGTRLELDKQPVDRTNHRVYSRTLNTQFSKRQELRYGENPHQSAAFYIEKTPPQASVSTAVQLQGKALSFNNIADTDAALECVKCFEEPACVIVKHANPCGVAVAESPLRAYELAFATDPTSAFGGIIAFNRELDAATAALITANQFSEVIIAPTVAKAALEKTAAKQNVRVLSCGAPPEQPAASLDYKRVNGGLLVQDQDQHRLLKEDCQLVTERSPTGDEFKDLLFAWIVAQYVKSNAIVYAKDRRTIGVGAGQMSRVYSARVAALKAADEGLTVRGSVMASDAFFPFRDAIDAAAEAGINAIIQPGGSMRDAEVIAAANEHGMAMVFTGTRHFRH